MELNTRCPECGTVFPASLEQMKLRKGYIRCVNCANIFDGFEFVVSTDTPDTSPRPTSREPIQASDSVPLRAEPGLPASRRSPPRVDLHTLNLPDDAPDSDTAGDGNPENEPVSVYIEPREDRVRRPAGAEFLTHRREATSSGWGGLIALLVVLALLVGAALLVYAYRVQIASSAPAVRPWLERACVSIGCTVPYPQRVDRISIMDSSLQAGESEAVMQLNVVMRNTFGKAQQWPVLMLDLVDFSGAVVATKTYRPSDYLPDETRDLPFQAGQEVRLNIPVEVDDLKVNGYQLRKVFPDQGTK
ncbi:zinc-ribbon and DUF3426 domain-containing protein [Neopusillimonas maritima]|uniref:Zinc finger/thioredoxin putative domain-containing protein n=1 Tax=Neopusillimonas maritima TaxID=2026239 RepID=A0ABX9N3Z3_9BURK|nr:zinc-ribbon and DUF3426 domain-containing protein [Neopusillimonas maritima]RII84452.1 hypothetical protein CJO09_04380 [Neopusillimonas maritima]